MAAADTVAAAEEKRSIKLSVPVKFGEEIIAELSYRKPTGADIVQCGHPLKINFAADPVEYSFDEQKMARMMATLYAQPPSVIGRLDPNDWTTCAWAIAGFFTPDLSKI